MHEAFSLFFLGMTSGATLCSLSCLPYYGTYLMGTGGGFLGGMTSSLCFSLGKVCSYSILGGSAAFLGQVFTFDHSHHLLMGLCLIMAALTIPFSRRPVGCRSSRTIGGRRTLFILGIFSALPACPPLAAVLLMAADSGNIASGISYGLIYGTGLVLSPMLILAGGFALISEKIQQETKGFAPCLRGLAMLIMIGMAVNMIAAA